MIARKPLLRIALPGALCWSVVTVAGVPTTDIDDLSPTNLVNQGAATSATGNRNLDSDFHECSIGESGASLPAECATIEVPLDPDDPTGEQLPLSVVRIAAQRGGGPGDPFTLIAGGPGQSAIEAWPQLSFAFRHIAHDRDIILIDQRGTGDSARLDCPESSDVLPDDPDADAALLRTMATECLDSLAYDPRFFTTSVAVRDLERVRQRLNIGQWNLYGVSYGTRVAQHYARRFPNSVRSMILDAVVPADIALGPEVASVAQQALDHLFTRCAADDGCQSRFSNIGEQTRELLNKLEREPLSLSFEDAATGELKTIEFGHRELAGTLRLMSYNALTAAILPSMLHAAVVNDHFAPLARQSEMQADVLGQTLATGMHHAVVCTEDEPFITPADESLQDNTDNYLGSSLVDALHNSCSAWPAGIIDADFKEPLESSIPTLLLSGEADPITPPSYADRVAQTLSNARHIVNADQGHMQAPLGCMPSVMARFVNTLDTDTLDVRCLQRLTAPPFFVDANGPLP